MANFEKARPDEARHEGRVGIIKNVFMAGRSLSKGIESRRQELAWIMLSHNLRVLARKRIAEQQGRELRRETKAAAATG